MNESEAAPSPSVTVIMDSDETVTPAADGLNRAFTPRNDREGACAKTPPSLPAARRERMSRLTTLGRGARQGAMTVGEERVPGPVRREMKPEPADTAEDATGDFEQLEPDRADGGRRQARAREDRPTEIGEQQEREAVELQPERVGAEAMTAKPVGVDVEFELFDPILGRPAGIVPGNEIGGAPAPIRDHEAHVEALRRDVDLDQNASLMRPRFRAMPEAGTQVDGAAGPPYRHSAFVTSPATRAVKTLFVPIPRTYRTPSASSLASTAGVAMPASPRRKIGVCGNRRRSGGSRCCSSSTTHAALGSRPGRKRERSSNPVRPSNQRSG